MKNFATHFWKRFEADKEQVAFIDAHDGTEESYWVWTRRVQKLAVGLMDAGFEEGTRVGMVATNRRPWLDLAFAVWLAGGCVVPLVPERDRAETLRCMARAGAAWIVVDDRASLERLRGQRAKLPEGLRWLSIDALSSGAPAADAQTLDLDHLMERGHFRLHRGDLKALAARTYARTPRSPALILFPFDPGDDPQGALYSDGKLTMLLEHLGDDLDLRDDDRIAVLASYGWFYGLLLTLATLLQGRALLTAKSLSALSTLCSESSSAAHAHPTRLLCGPAYLQGLMLDWQARIEAAPEWLRASEDDQRTGLKGVLSSLGERAAIRLLYEPVKAALGGRLARIYLAGGRAPGDAVEILERAGIDVLALWGLPEAGISHLERPGARRPGSVGRPVQGYACRIANARAEGAGEILLRSEVLFDGYWSGAGPRHVDEEGWLHTGVTGRIESGHLILQEADG